MKTKHQVIVKAQNGSVLTYNVDYFDVQDGFVCFKDRKDNDRIKRYAISNCEIVTEGDSFE